MNHEDLFLILFGVFVIALVLSVIYFVFFISPGNVSTIDSFCADYFIDTGSIFSHSHYYCPMGDSLREFKCDFYGKECYFLDQGAVE